MKEIRKYVQREVLTTKKNSCNPTKQKVNSNNHKKSSTFKRTLIVLGFGLATYLLVMGARATDIVNEEYGGVTISGGGSGDPVMVFPEGYQPTATDYWEEFIEQVSTFGRGKN